MRRLGIRSQNDGPREPADGEFAAALLENVADAVVACDATGSIVMLNRRARELLGVPSHVGPAGIPTENWAEFYGLYPRDGSGLTRTDDLPLLRALRGEDVRDVELEVRGDGRRTTVVNVSGGPVIDSRGQTQGAVIVMQDITDRVAVEDRLRLQSAVVANIGAGVALVRADDGDIVYANERWERMFGYGPGELVGCHISVVNAPTDRTPEERAQEIFDALEGSGVWSGEVHNVRKDGAQFWTSCSVSRFEDPEHGTVWISVNTDITERRAATDALNASEERFRTAFEQSPVATALVDNELCLTDANHALCELLGYRREELTGRPLADITHPDDVDVDAHLRAMVFRGEVPRYRIEKRLVTKQGDTISIVLSGTVARGPDGRALRGIAIVEEVAR